MPSQDSRVRAHSQDVWLCNGRSPKPVCCLELFWILEAVHAQVTLGLLRDSSGGEGAVKRLPKPETVVNFTQGLMGSLDFCRVACPSGKKPTMPPHCCRFEGHRRSLEGLLNIYGHGSRLSFFRGGLALQPCSRAKDLTNLP